MLNWIMPVVILKKMVAFTFHRSIMKFFSFMISYHYLPDHRSRPSSRTFLPRDPPCYPRETSLLKYYFLITHQNVLICSKKTECGWHPTELWSCYCTHMSRWVLLHQFPTELHDDLDLGFRTGRFTAVYIRARLRRNTLLYTRTENTPITNIDLTDSPRYISEHS